LLRGWFSALAKVNNHFAATGVRHGHRAGRHSSAEHSVTRHGLPPRSNACPGARMSRWCSR